MTAVEGDADRDRVGLLLDGPLTDSRLHARGGPGERSELTDERTKRGKLDAQTRREIVLAALCGAEKKALAAEHGISRQWLYDLLEDATADPQGRLEDAVAETTFRRKVCELLIPQIGDSMEKVPNLHDKDDNWLTSFTHQAVLARNQVQITAADAEWRRRGRPDVVPRVENQFGS